MNLNNATDLAVKTRSVLSRIGLVMSKNMPQILVWGGIVGGTAATVLACIATTKATGVIDRTQEDLDHIRQKRETLSKDEYTDKEHQKELVVVYTNTVLDFAHIYAPSVILGLASAGAIVSGERLLNKRNVGLMAAFKVVDESYKSYRERVRQEFGDEKERELRYPGETKAIVVGQDQEGKDIVKTKTIPFSEEGMDVTTGFGRWFDNTNVRWFNSKYDNYFFLSTQQTYLNNQLNGNGYVFLNDVYKILGFKPTKAGQQVGWAKKRGGSVVIDFGLKDFDYYTYSVYHMDENGDNCMEGFYLDFNVQGVILDMLDGD